MSLILSAKNEPHFCEYDNDNGWVNKNDEYGIGFQPLAEQLKERLWLVRDYQQSLEGRENEYQSVEQLSLRYGEISFSPHEKSGIHFYYNDQMGLSTFNVSE